MFPQVDGMPHMPGSRSEGLQGRASHHMVYHVTGSSHSPDLKDILPYITIHDILEKAKLYNEK